MISDRPVRSSARVAVLLIAVFAVAGCAPTRNRQAMSDPYPALGSVPRALVSELVERGR
jgi:hypothetical protein